MSVSVCVHKYNAKPLIQKIATVCKTDDVALIEQVLSMCGTFVGDYYILLQNDFWEEYNAYFQVSTILEKVFEVEGKVDVFSTCFCYPRDEAIGFDEICIPSTLDEIYDILNIDPEENEDED